MWRMWNRRRTGQSARPSRCSPSSTLGLQNHVGFLGQREDIPSLLQMSDIFVFSSHYEGIPNAVIEGQAAGLPVVAFRIPGLEEVMEDGKSGLVVEPRDVFQFGNAVVQMARHQSLASSMGERGQQIVREKFDIRNNTKKLEDLYERLLGSK